MANYYVRADGTATNKAAATGGATAGTSMSVAVLNTETFAPGDSILFSDGGGVFKSQVAPPSSGNNTGIISFQPAYGANASFNLSTDITGLSWSDQGGDVWAASIGVRTNAIMQLWINGGQWGTRVSLSSAVGAFGEFYNNNTTGLLYVYATSNPSIYYDLIEAPLDFRAAFFLEAKSYIKVDGFNISYVGNDYTSVPNASIMQLAGCNNNIFSNNTISKCTRGIGSYYNSSGLKISNNSISDVFHTYSSGFPAAGIISLGANALIDNNNFNGITTRAGGSPINMGIGVLLRQLANQNPPSGTIISNNIIENTNRYGIYGSGEDTTKGIVNTGIQVFGNTVNSDISPTNDSDGIAFGGASSNEANHWSNIKINNNIISGTGNTGIYLTNYMGSESFIYHNVIKSCGTKATATAGIGSYSQDVKIHSNIVINQINGRGICSLSGHSAIINNIIDGVLNGYGITAIRDSYASGGNNLIHNASSGYTSNFTNTNGVNSNPLLVSSVDFHLQPPRYENGVLVDAGSPCIGAGTAIIGITTDIEGNPLFPPYNIGPFGLADGALGVSPVVNDGAPRNNITRLTGTSTTLDPAGACQFADTNAWRVVTGWTAGTANDFFDENGVPIPFAGQKLIDAGIGPRLYCGETWIAGYTVDQENPEQLSSWC